MPQKLVIASNGDPTNEPPWGSTLKIETGAKNIMPTPLTGGQEISFAPQMIFLWPPARGVGKLDKVNNNLAYRLISDLTKQLGILTDSRLTLDYSGFSSCI